MLTSVSHFIIRTFSSLADLRNDTRNDIKAMEDRFNNCFKELQKRVSDLSQESVRKD